MNNSKRDHKETERRAALAHERAAGAPLGDIRLSLLVKHNAWLLGALMDKALVPYGLSGIEYVALMYLRSTTDNLANPSDLCRSMAETRSNMTRITDELVGKNLIKRIPNIEDRRKVDLSLTEQAIDLLRQVVPVVRERVHTVFDVFSPEAKHALEQELLQLKQSLEAQL